MNKIEFVAYSESNFFNEADKQVLQDIFSFVGDFECITDPDMDKLNIWFRQRVEMFIRALNSAKINKDQILTYLLAEKMINEHRNQKHDNILNDILKELLRDD